jgi:hypothetical protein
MSSIPKRIEVSSKWFDVREGWAGTLELFEYGKYPQYTAKEAYMHINNLFFVYDTNGSKVGEFDTNNRSCSGCVTNYKM